MYYSTSIEEQRVEIFKTLIGRTLEGFEGYKNEISKVVSDAKDLCTGRKDMYGIDNSHFFLIVFLKKNGADFLTKLDDPKNLKEDDYKRILSIFNSEVLQPFMV